MPSKRNQRQKLTKRGLTPRQKRLVPLLGKVSQGEMTKVNALRKAGYSEKSALQQSAVFGSIRNNGPMQQALRAVGFDEAFIATKIVTGAKLLRPGKPQLGYLQTGAELLSAFPPKTTIAADASIEDLIKSQESDSPSQS